MVKTAVALLVSILGLTSTVAAQADPVRIHARLYKSNATGSKYKPFKSGAKFQVVVRLYGGEPVERLLGAGGDLWEETLTVSTKSSVPSSPPSGDIREPAKISGEMDLLLGALAPLPADLLQVDAWFTTQVTTLKPSGPGKTYKESPKQPLGIAGFTGGQAIEPASVDTVELRVGTSAVSGHVLTSDADGNATWQPVPAGPGVSGTTGKVPLFTSSSSIGDSIISQSDSVVSIVGQLYTTQTITTVSGFMTDGTVFANDSVDSGGQITAGTNIDAGGNITADGGITAGGTITGSALTANGAITGTTVTATALVKGATVEASGKIVVGEPSTFSDKGDIVADDDILSDDDVDAGGDVHATGDILSDDDVDAGGDVHATGDILSDDDVVAGDDVYATGTSIYLGTADNDSDPAAVISFGDLGFYTDYDNDDDPGGSGEHKPWFRWWTNNSSSGLDEKMRLNDYDGKSKLFLEGDLETFALDFAEYYPTVDSRKLRPGTVVAVDGARREHVVAAERGYSEAVLGIVSTAPGVVCGGEMNGLHPEILAASDAAFSAGNYDVGQFLRQQWSEIEAKRTDRVAVALAGRVPVLVDGSGGAIRAGDQLGMGASAGVAARYAGFGPVIGIALQEWTGEESIVAFVHLDWSPDGSYQPLTRTDGSSAAVPREADETNAAIFPAGATQTIVSQRGLDATSRPVVTFFGNPGGSWWVSERGAGYFVLALERPAPMGLEFAWSLVD